MATVSKSVNLEFFINGDSVNAPIEWGDIEIISTFENENIQANITTDKFTFVLEAYKLITQYITDGITSNSNGIFEGIPFQIKAINRDNELIVFDGYLDLVNDLIDNIEEGKIECNIKKSEGLNNLETQLEGLTYGFLLQEGVITSADFIDVKYVVEKPLNAFEILSSSIILYLMAKELEESIRSIIQDITIIFSIGVSGITGPVGGAAYGVASIIFQIIYIAALLIAIINIGRQLLDTFISPLRVHKAITQKRLLEAAAESIGLGFETDIPELLNNIKYLASNPHVDTENSKGFISKVGTITDGIPNINDFGYRVSEMFALAKNEFNALISVIDGVIQFRSENSPFWVKTSTFILPDILTNERKYNTNELVKDRIISFDTDIKDTWTIDNFKGTNFEIITDAITVDKIENKSIRGIDDIRINACLGNVKNELNALESALLSVSKVIDSLTGIFGGGTNYAQRIKLKTGVLKVSDNNHSKPKLLYFEGNSIPVNHREVWSAKVLYDNYHVFKSFVADEFNGQKIIHDGVKIPFGFDDFIKVIENSYFTDNKGKSGKFKKNTWRLNSDFAIVDYFIREVYTTNLKETFIEAE